MTHSARSHGDALSTSWLIRLLIAVPPCILRAMPLLTIVMVIVVVGVLLWALNSFIPMDQKIRSILNAVVVIVLILWLLQAFGILGSLGSVRVGK